MHQYDLLAHWLIHAADSYVAPGSLSLDMAETLAASAREFIAKETQEDVVDELAQTIYEIRDAVNELIELELEDQDDVQ
jgi:TRAP-type uncharacterized transport system substrate-binding protein